MGYWTSGPIRFTIALLFIPLIFHSTKKPPKTVEFIYLEILILLCQPLHSTYFFLRNDQNQYWNSSLIFSGLILGLFAKTHLMPVNFIIGSVLGTGIYYFQFEPSLQELRQSLGAQSISFLTAIVGAAIKTSLEIFYQKSLQTKLAEEKAKDLMVKNEELLKREELIRLYVRPSLVDEIRAGIDPSKSEPVIKNLSIMFCDIREFTKLTETLTPYERQMFLNQYFSMMTRPIVDNGGEVDKIMGDCVMSVFPDGDKAIKAAIAMRLELHKFNETMFAVHSPMIRNGIGIAKGEVMQGNFGSFEKLDRTVIGEAVNIASRLESKTKMYNLEVVVTEDVIQDLAPGSEHYRWIDVVQVKGSTRNLRLYEVYGHQPLEVRQYKDETRELLEKALTIYFQKGFKDASRLFRAMLEKVPPHTLKTGILMDEILNYYIAHCNAWINNPNGTWEEIQRWDGVHVFTEK
ncbi:MAG: adenylate/guanylate cyclase domain-containing protein [Fibrobacterota bacterium]|nr:adenylate/guanylate cyclase domain-containing protein [Fibrobacterota bacterium]